MHTQSLRLLACTAALSLTLPLGAQVLMMDFGGTTVSGTDLTNSPYHSVNTGFADGTWNKVTASSTAGISGLKYADDQDATGISYTQLKNIGSTGVNATRALAGAPGSGTTNGAMNTGIYAGTSVGGDAIRFSSTLTDNRGFGVQIYGLAVGTYDIYVSGRDASITSDYNMNFYVGVGSKTVTTNTSTGYVDITSGFEVKTTSFTGTDNTATWLYDSSDPANSNYAKFSISITAENPNLTVFALGDSGAAIAQGYLSSLQIVAIPEPSSFALLGGAAGLFLAVGLRRRRKN